MCHRRGYWIPPTRWQLEDWFLTEGTLGHGVLPRPRSRSTCQLYAIYFQLMEELHDRKPVSSRRRRKPGSRPSLFETASGTYIS